MVFITFVKNVLMLLFPSAKINLGLQVLKKCDDGFHDISSVLYPVPLFDVLEAKQAGKKTQVFMYPEDKTISLQKNLVYKAWELINDSYGIPAMEFHLKKTIPSQAGLGGASADAVAALHLCKNLAKLNISDLEMYSLAAELGSDCPFFLHNNAQHISGRGDVTEDISLSLNGMYLQIVKHKELHDGSAGISTAEAYSKILTNASRKPVLELIKSPISEWKDVLENDFQQGAIECYPEIAEIIETFYDSDAVYAAMSGSGSACFALFTKKPENEIFPGQQYFVFGSYLL